MIDRTEASRGDHATMMSSWRVRWDRAVDAAPTFFGPHEVVALEDGRTLTVAFEGVLHDRGAGAATRAPAVDVARAYAARGDDSQAFADALRGAYALALWDASRRKLVLVRDATGLTPCLWHAQGQVIRAGPALDPLLADLPTTPAFDRLVMAEYLAGHFTRAQQRETFYEGVRRLPAGHLLEVDAAGLREARYFDPLPPGFEWASPSEQAGLLEVFERAVERCLEAGADCLALSGGYDSTAIAAAAAQRRGGRAPLEAICVRFEWTDVDEAARQRHTASHFGMPLSMRSSRQTLDGGVVGAALAYSAVSPSPVLSLWQGIYAALLAGASDRGLAGMLQGSGGDELFDVDASYVRDCLQRRNVGDLGHYLAAVLRAAPGPALTVGRHLLWRGGLRPWLGDGLSALSPQLADAVRVRDHALWPRDVSTLQALRTRRLQRRPRGAEGAYADSLRNLVASPLMAIELDQSWTLMRGRGFSAMLPFLDRDLLSLALRLPPRLLLQDGLNKAPLRRYVARQVPGFPEDVKKVAFTAYGQRLLMQPARELWRRLDGARLLSEAGVADRREAARAMDAFLSGRIRHTMQAWLLLSAAHWLHARSAVA